MKIATDNRLDAFKRLEHLLYGSNYQVWFNLYGPLDCTTELEQSLRERVSKDARINNISQSSPEETKAAILADILYEGDEAAGPLGLDDKREEVISLMNEVFSQIDIDQANLIRRFEFREGHPAYPVFWDFAYDIHSNSKRWILVGSSSD